jgi:hypothetical protein
MLPQLLHSLSQLRSPGIRLNIFLIYFNKIITYNPFNPELPNYPQVGTINPSSYILFRHPSQSHKSVALTSLSAHLSGTLVVAATAAATPW